MDPSNYALIPAKCLARLERNWRVRASWRRHRILTQRSHLCLPAELAPLENAPEPPLLGRGSALGSRPLGVG